MLWCSARDMWKKRYFEEKKKTMPLEEIVNRCQGELEALHRKLMSMLEGPSHEKKYNIGANPPSQKVTALCGMLPMTSVLQCSYTACCCLYRTNLQTVLVLHVHPVYAAGVLNTCFACGFLHQSSK